MNLYSVEAVLGDFAGSAFENLTLHSAFWGKTQTAL